MKNLIIKSVGLVSLIILQVNAQDLATVTIKQPEFGAIVVEPQIPVDGELPVGTVLNVSVSPVDGYQLDSLYKAVPGPWGNAYIESMSEMTSFVVDQDLTISALLLPETELQGFSVIQNVVYAQPGVKELKYDVWTPDNAEALPIVVIIHGGGWRSNTEDIMRGMAREIVKTGKYVVASIDYRWLGDGDGVNEENDMSDLINDVFGAVAHIQEHAEGFKGDPRRIAVTGDSAGGHLSAVVATMPHRIGSGGFGENDQVFDFMPSYLPAGKSAEEVRDEILSAVQVAAPSYGVFSESSEPGLMHHSVSSAADASWAAAIAPINHIQNEVERSIPHYFVRGTEDMLISHEMVQDYADALEEKGQRVHYDQVEGANHAFFDWKPDQITRDTFKQFGVPYTEVMIDFFDTVFYP